MSKQFRSPQEKKDLAYKKDHRVKAKRSAAAEKDSPTQKVYTNRSYRHKVEQILHSIETGVADEDLQNLPADALPVRRPQVKKANPVPLRNAVKISLSNRVRYRLRSFCRTPYNSEQHKESFTNFLNFEIKNRTAYARELAFYLEKMLSPRGRYNPRTPYSLPDLYYNWLQAYFKDVPEMEDRLRDWIKDITVAKEILL